MSVAAARLARRSLAVAPRPSYTAAMTMPIAALQDHAPGHPPLERRAVAAVILGNALEFYDFTAFVFFAKSIGLAFFPLKEPGQSLLASLALFGIGYVMRPVGGVVIGAFADRAGRKPAMLVTIALMAIGMLMLALTPSYASIGAWAQGLVIAGRLIQGLALGGEIGPSTAYLLEAAAAPQRGFIASWQIASQGCAALAVGILSLVLTLVIGDAAMSAWGWRVLFLLGISVVPVGLVIRSHLPETAGMDEDGRAAGSTLGVLRRLWRDHARLLCVTFALIAASNVSSSIGTNMPTYAGSTLGLAGTVSTLVTIAFGLASIAFPLFGGLLADRFGRRPVLIWPRLAILLLCVPAFAILRAHPTAVTILAVTFLLSALSSVNAAAIIVGIPESLPKAVRSAGLSIVYALAVSIFGSSTNFLVNLLINLTGDKLAPAYYLAAFSVVGTVAAFLMPETKGRELD